MTYKEKWDATEKAFKDHNVNALFFAMEKANKVYLESSTAHSEALDAYQKAFKAI